VLLNDHIEKMVERYREAGQTIGNRYDHSQALDGLGAGAPVETVVLRGGGRMTLTIPAGGGE
jgi:hypothetical protein